LFTYGILVAMLLTKIMKSQEILLKRARFLCNRPHRKCTACRWVFS